MAERSAGSTTMLPVPRIAGQIIITAKPMGATKIAVNSGRVRRRPMDLNLGV
ncbi:hypothetical protein MTDSW087_05563 [Methylobacterium dankookense]|uniref:Uncharacterized protein n=1 Tax=Methylobacterium dankookense TaxID=560405 RepID=A0A564G5I8_9HYPH|nr:hypothetical protein IFDJLNFL_5374 [Methylobacterium dankookense]VUF15815.1 hypothetical protein MTDSW087_05563 [Methylobacterium dankookense]